MEGYKINPELEAIKLDEETKEKMKKLKSVDFDTVMERAEKAGYKVTYSGIDFNGIPHIKVRKRQ